MQSIPPKIYFFVQIGVGVMLASYNAPLMNSFFTPFLHGQGVDEGIIGWLFSFYSMTSILTSLTLSKFHRSVVFSCYSQENRHQILALGLFLVGSSLYIVSLLPLIQNFSLLIAACLLQRFVNGIGFSLLVNAVYAYIQIVFNDELETYNALNILLASVGDFTSSIVGSSLYKLGSFYLPFATIGTLTVIYSLYTLYSLKITLRSLKVIDPLLPAEHEPQPVEYWKIFNCQVVTCLILMFSLIFTLAYIAPFYSNYIIEEFHINQQDVGYYTFIPSVATALSVLLNSGIHTYMRRLLVGGLFFAGFFTPFTGPDYRLTIIPHTLVVSLVSYSLSNFFYGFPAVRVLVVLNKQLLHQLSDKEQAAVLGSVLFTSFSGLGEITGPIAGGYMIKLTNFPTACSLLGVYTVVLSIYSGFSLLIRNKKQKMVQSTYTLEDTIISQPQKGEIN